MRRDVKMMYGVKTLVTHGSSDFFSIDDNTHWASESPRPDAAASSASKSCALQPCQPPPVVLDLGKAGVEFKKADDVMQPRILEPESEAQAIKLVNEAANQYFTGNAQLLRRLETL